MSHFRGDPRASDLTLFLYSQNLWLTKPSLRIRLTRSQKIENGLTVLEWSWMMILIKFLNSFTNLLLTFDERGVGARSMSKQKISGVLPWDTLWDTNLPANERQHHLVSTNRTSPQPTMCSEWNHGKEDACCILEASLSRTPVQALDLLPSYLCNPHRRCGRDGMEVGSVALVDSYVAVKSRLPDILVILSLTQGPTTCE